MVCGATKSNQPLKTSHDGQVGVVEEHKDAMDYLQVFELDATIN